MKLAKTKQIAEVTHYRASAIVSKEKKKRVIPVLLFLSLGFMFSIFLMNIFLRRNNVGLIVFFVFFNLGFYLYGMTSMVRQENEVEDRETKLNVSPILYLIWFFIPFLKPIFNWLSNFRFVRMPLAGIRTFIIYLVKGLINLIVNADKKIQMALTKEMKHKFSKIKE
jgi:uncharacterized membrane protein